MKTRFVILFIGFLCIGYAQQDINRKIDSLATIKALKIVDSLKKAQEKPKTPTKKPSLNTKLNVDGYVTDGNIKRTLLTTRASLSLSKGKVFWFSMNPSFTYGETNKQVQEREYFTDLSTTAFYEKRIYGLAFGIAESSNLRKVKTRTLAGAGLGFRFIKNNPNADLTMSIAGIYEHTDFLTKNDITTARVSVRLRGTYTLFKGKLKLYHLGFFQPSVLDTKNVRWNGIANIEIPVSEHFSLRASVENSYESVVAEGRKNNDFRSTFGFSITK